MKLFTKACKAIWYGLIFAASFMYLGFSIQQASLYEAIAKTAESKYQYQRTADLIGFLKNQKTSMGCPVDEVSTLPKKGKRGKRVC